jgi:hypothetical protein
MKYCPTMKIAAIRTAARIARFSVLTPTPSGQAADPSHLDERADISRVSGARATGHAGSLAR